MPLCKGEKILLNHTENDEKECNDTNHDGFNDINQEIYVKYKGQESLD